MQTFPNTIILRHRKENLKKCSLRGLESRKDCDFYTYPRDSVPSLEGYIMLDLEGPELTRDDSKCGLFILDATWRHAGTMLKQTKEVENCIKRSLSPEWKTAYPRKQEDCPDPTRGLASIEALFAAYLIMGRKTDGLLDNYYWKEDFLEKNRQLIEQLSMI